MLYLGDFDVSLLNGGGHGFGCVDGGGGDDDDDGAAADCGGGGGYLCELTVGVLVHTGFYAVVAVAEAVNCFVNRRG